LVYYDINGDPCDPATCVWVDVSQDACDCHWDFPAFTVEGVTSCTDFLDDFTNNECFFEYSPSVNFCTLNPVVHCVEKPRCDVDENGQIDSVDVDAIYARLGQAATDECDPADVTQSGEISIVDASHCAEQCTYELPDEPALRLRPRRGARPGAAPPPRDALAAPGSTGPRLPATCDPPLGRPLVARAPTRRPDRDRLADPLGEPNLFGPGPVAPALLPGRLPLEELRDLRHR
jgi:hypothetical protein